ncbi:hypothetical protein EWM62_01570 [Mucilaginibacter terrigena]|uniref:Uncharacterized protein n=1 Tax=Mucilaginibacter terrigena TaxID=2492395 RepID=A0A4Q5LRI2_9SPHI|nr:hypothetical protein [Mucilaginibacter terrigena]RYU92156.1 hypothetical protein EWM62_01570 [Mucilaginibacter terrigena]
MFGCKSKPTTIDLKDSVPWQRLTIVDEKDVGYFIQNNTDPGYVIVYHRGSFFAPQKKTFKQDTLRVNFTNAENDTLAYIMKDLIVHPVKTEKFCTDFVGSLNLKINYGQYELSGRYSSVCDWSQLSDKTRQLKAILNRKFAEAKKNNK